MNALYQTDPRSTVVAPADGAIVNVTTRLSALYHTLVTAILIQHDGGFASMINWVQAAPVQLDTEVQHGDAVGTALIPAIEFGLSLNDVFIDPRAYFGK